MKYNGCCPYCNSGNVDFVDADDDSVKMICRDCGKDYLVLEDETVVTRNNRIIERKEEHNYAN